MAGELVLALGALSNAANIAKGMLAVRDANLNAEQVLDLNGKIIDAQSAIMAAQEQQAENLEQIRTLRNQIATFEDWERHKANYKLSPIRDGQVVYIAVRNGEDSQKHMLCATCFEGRRKSFLNRVHLPVGRSSALVCTMCKAVIYDQGQAHSEHAPILRAILHGK